MAFETFQPDEDLFVITAREGSELSTPVFSVDGPAGDSPAGEEGVAIFLTRRAAEEYIANAGWDDTDTVAEITPQAVVKWLVAVRGDGPSVLIVNPRRDEQRSGRSQNVLKIDELLSHLGSIVVARAAEAREPLPAVVVAHMITRCPVCGRVEKRTTSQELLKCHGQTMVAESLETHTVHIESQDNP